MALEWGSRICSACDSRWLLLMLPAKVVAFQSRCSPVIMGKRRENHGKTMGQWGSNSSWKHHENLGFLMVFGSSTISNSGQAHFIQFLQHWNSKHRQKTVTLPYPACCMACLASESTMATSALMDFSFSSASYRAMVVPGRRVAGSQVFRGKSERESHHVLKPIQM